MNSADIESLWARASSHFLSVQELILVAEYSARKNGDSDIAQSVFNGRYCASIHLLIGFALELSLKSAYYCHGGNRKEARSANHDLVAALDLAEGVGFLSAAPKLRWVAEMLRETHLSHHFRYGTKSVVSMPEIADSMEVLSALYEEIGFLVYENCEE